ncbi:hypothetical protein Tco_0814752 [Tanacetum coccineum]
MLAKGKIGKIFADVIGGSVREPQPRAKRRDVPWNKGKKGCLGKPILGVRGMLGSIAMVDGGYWTLLCNKMSSAVQEVCAIAVPSIVICVAKETLKLLGCYYYCSSIEDMVSDDVRGDPKQRHKTFLRSFIDRSFLRQRGNVATAEQEVAATVESMEKAARYTSNKYVEAALNSATVVLPYLVPCCMFVVINVAGSLLILLLGLREINAANIYVNTVRVY